MANPVLPAARLAALLDTHAAYGPVPLVPTLSAWRADDELPLWGALEEACGQRLGAPFFAVPWPGAQALALLIERGLLDVAGRRVLDVGCGSGLAAVAAARRGGWSVACDTDALACTSAQLLAARHQVTIAALVTDPLATPWLGARFDVVLAGDLVYSHPQRESLRRAVGTWMAAGVTVLLADSGRPFFDACGLKEHLSVDVPVPRAVEGQPLRTVRVYASTSPLVFSASPERLRP